MEQKHKPTDSDIFAKAFDSPFHMPLLPLLCVHRMLLIFLNSNLGWIEQSLNSESDLETKYLNFNRMMTEFKMRRSQNWYCVFTWIYGEFMPVLEPAILGIYRWLKVAVACKTVFTS